MKLKNDLVSYGIDGDSTVADLLRVMRLYGLSLDDVLATGYGIKKGD